MIGQQVAQGLAGLGRGKDTMLMHVTPNEVAGLQSLAMAHGGSLTINPETGLPEAGFFDDILGAVAPIALGAFLGPAGLGMSALGAGIATGALGYLASGDIMTGLSSGLGGFGGGNLGSSLASNVAPTTLVPEVSKAGMSSIPGTTGASMFTDGASNALSSAATEAATGTLPYAGSAGAGSSFIPPHLVSSPTSAAATAANTIGDATVNAAAVAVDPISTAIPKVASFGDKVNTMGKGALNAIKDPMAFFGKEGPGTLMDGLTLASPLMAIQPEMPGIPKDDSYQMKYEGPYTAQDRKPRTPTQEEMTQLAAAGSPEYSYFGDTNPYPGFNKARGYSQGGVATLYNNSDGTPAQNKLDENYGIGRLNRLAQASANSGASQYQFNAGGEIPYMGGAPSYGIAPTDLSQVAAIPTSGAEASSSSGVSRMLGNAITDPLGRTTGDTQGGMGGKGGNQNSRSGIGGKGGFANKLKPPAPPALTMQDYITAATRTYDPNASMAAAMDPSGIERAHFTNINPQAPVMSAGQPVPSRAMGGGLKNGGFVVPADVVSHLGNGSTDAGLAALQKRKGAQPIRGAGDGMSDSIKTNIEGRIPARIANGEAYIPPEQVKRSGGAKNLYAMMDKVRKARTGSKKQGKQINPNKFMSA